MKKKIIYILLCSVISLNAETIQLPTWFTNAADKEYVGISEPNGCENQAIAMAIIQYMFTNRVTGVGEYIGLISGLDDDSYTSRSHETKSFNVSVSFDVLDIQRLSSGEYICRITEGNTHTILLEISYQNETVTDNNSLFESKTICTIKTPYWNWSIESQISNDDAKQSYLSRFMDVTVGRELINKNSPIAYSYKACQPISTTNKEIVSMLTNTSLCRALLNAYCQLLTYAEISSNSQIIEYKLNGRVVSMELSTMFSKPALFLYVAL